jgi:hypothetical protein
LCFRILDVRVQTHDVEPILTCERKHDRKRLTRPLFAFSQDIYRIGVACIAHQVIAANAFDRDNLAVTQAIQCHIQRFTFLDATRLARAQET